ncbi:phosphotransferase family protein [Microbacterium sp. NPDC057407]|uniref:phosphotransferase family protein n=1 Tax=Microbacterium sp. NPDC057407 TaxID=3346120 RepID=UPI00366EFFB5
MRQGAVGHVRVIDHRGQAPVEKRMTDPARHDTEVAALTALAGSGLPAPTLLEVAPGSIVMTRLPGDRLDAVGPDERLDGLRESMRVLRRLHALPVPDGLPPAADDRLIVERYIEAGGPPLPLVVPGSEGRAFCHGDWTDGNLLAIDGEVTGVVDWEAAHAGDPIRELARAAWGASRKDARSFDAMVEAYGADRDAVAAWTAVHAAELWLWFAAEGPPEYLDQLTAELVRWPLG